jgi:hypothetical protein
MFKVHAVRGPVRRLHPARVRARRGVPGLLVDCGPNDNYEPYLKRVSDKRIISYGGVPIWW